MSDPYLWYRDKDTLPIGGVRRYIIEYTQAEAATTEIYLRLKNIEKTTIRAVHLLNGPFILYCHVVPVNFDHKKPFSQKDKEVHFNNQLKPGQTFNVPLYLNDNSRVKDNVYQWKLDILSQIVITSETTVLYDLMVGADLKELKRLNHGSLRSLTGLSGGQEDNYIPLNEVLNPQLTINKITGEELWSRPPDYNKPAHLVILTHGIFSNLTGDMLYCKETLEDNVNDNLIIKGYNGNAGKTEGGVKKLGSKQGKYLMKLIDNLINEGIVIDKISFIGHSLGGLTQLYSIKFILDADPLFFQKRTIKPQNLVFVASPLLGILNEISFLISWLLDLGTLGKTGRDLTLSRSKLRGKPLLEELPDQLHQFLKLCKNLIIYANIINDGIVPLRTSALLYLDYVTLDNVKDLKKKKEGQEENPVGQIPAQKQPDKINTLEKYKQFISLNFSINDSSKKRVKLQKKILHINAKGKDNLQPDENVELGQDEAEENDLDAENAGEEYPDLNIPPKASIIESAINSIICPIPNEKYIVDPESRHPVIFHDKSYKYTDIPAEIEGTPLFSKANKQVKIARKYHDELNWRKILVRLPSDAHNNIIVRRRFPNGYGWGVIDHICEVFNEPDEEPDEARPGLVKIKSKM